MKSNTDYKIFLKPATYVPVLYIIILSYYLSNKFYSIPV